MRFFLTGLAAVLFCAAGAQAQPANEQYDNPIPQERTFDRPAGTNNSEYDGLKPGLGREETYYAFSGCFKTGWIKKQHLHRTEWDMAIDKMVKDCNMEALDPDEKAIILDYLVKDYGYGH